MARVWIEDRKDQKDYKEAVKKAKEVKRKPPGRWRVRWYDPTGAPKSKTFAKKVDAEAKESDLEGQLASGAYRDPAAAKAPTSEVAEAWHAAQTHLKRRSKTLYREVLDNYILPRWGTTPVERIKHDEVAAWLSSLLGKPGKSGSEKRTIGPSHVRGIHRVFAQVMEWAVRSNRIAANPAVKVPLPRKPASAHVYLTHTEVDALAKAVAGLETKHKKPMPNVEVYRVLVLVLAYTGLRWGEASAVKVGRVDLEQRRIQVVEAYGDDNGDLFLGTPKNHEQRSVPIPAFLVEELKPLVANRGPDELLFTSRRGEPLRAPNFRSRVFSKAVKAAGLADRGVTPHKLRHTAASLAIAAGADVKVIQTMLGHASASMTLDVYGHLFPDRLDEVADALNDSRAVALAKAA